MLVLLFVKIEGRLKGTLGTVRGREGKVRSVGTLVIKLKTGIPK